MCSTLPVKNKETFCSFINNWSFFAHTPYPKSNSWFYYKDNKNFPNNFVKSHQVISAVSASDKKSIQTKSCLLACLHLQWWSDDSEASGIFVREGLVVLQLKWMAREIYTATPVNKTRTLAPENFPYPHELHAIILHSNCLKMSIIRPDWSIWCQQLRYKCNSKFSWFMIDVTFSGVGVFT